MQNMTIGQRIRERRKALDLSQEELAHRLGNKSRASVCTVEKDKEDLTTTRVKQYAEALDCSPAYLMGWEDINGVPISSERIDYRIPISAYRPEFVESAIEVYKEIQMLPDDKKAQLESYLQFLKSQS